MLAQLYRQQAEEGDLNAAISNGSTGSTSIDGDSTEVALANKRTSPRKQTKTAKLMFDDIRNRIIKEMMLLESKRRGALELKRKLGLLGDGKERVSLGDGADEVLQESEEQSLREVCAKKSKDDPSGTKLNLLYPFSYRNMSRSCSGCIPRTLGRKAGSNKNIITIWKTPSMAFIECYC